MERMYITWSCRLGGGGAHLCRKKMNNKEDMEKNGLTDGN